MCTRYQFSAEGCRALQRILELARPLPGQSEIKTGDIRPGDLAPVLVGEGAKIAARLMRWGYPNPRGKGLIVNARAESAGEKPMFRQSLAVRRCALVASSFYEWDAEKRKYRFSLPGEPLYLAGLYEPGEGEERFVVLTTGANASLLGIHERMPLLLTRESLRPWLLDGSAVKGILASAPPLLRQESDAPEQQTLYCAE